jgi:hypothetical protein
MDRTRVWMPNYHGRSKCGAATRNHGERMLREMNLMSKAEIHKSLERLRSELNALEGDKAVIEKRVNSLISDLERHLENLEDADHTAMLGRIRGVVEQFEAEHPSITAVLNRIMTTLSDMGI